MDFDFKYNYILEDERVTLIPLEELDNEKLLSFVLNEPELWKYSLVQLTDDASLSKYVSDACQARLDKKEYAFVVYDKQVDEYAGCTRFYDMQLAHKTLQLGYTWYGEKFHGTGLNLHCKYLMLDFAFGTIGVERVEFRADANNTKSISAMKKIGCKVEGILRSNVSKINGDRRDSIVLSILKKEWEGEIKALLLSKIKSKK